MKKFKWFALGLMIGCILMLSTSSLAATVKQFLLVNASYPIQVNGDLYENAELPVLNYQGNTYIPMKAVGQLLGANVTWNTEQRRAEITYGVVKDAKENNAFRNIAVTGTNGKYTVTGEARIFEAVMNYAISDGHSYLLEKNYMLNEGAPAWSAFSLEIVIPQDELPVNGTLMIELFEYSAKDGSQINLLQVPLEKFES